MSDLIQRANAALVDYKAAKVSDFHKDHYADKLATIVAELIKNHGMALDLLEDYIAAEQRMRDALIQCRKQADVRKTGEDTYSAPGWKQIMAITDKGLFGEPVTAGKQ